MEYHFKTKTNIYERLFISNNTKAIQLSIASIWKRRKQTDALQNRSKGRKYYFIGNNEEFIDLLNRCKYLN